MRDALLKDDDVTIETDDEFDAGFAASGGVDDATPGPTNDEPAAAAGDSAAIDTTNGSDDGGDGHPADPDASAPAAPVPAPAAVAPAPPAPSAAPASAPADDEDPAKLRQRLSTLQGMLRKESDEKTALRRQLDERSAAPPPPAPAPAAADDGLTEEDRALIQELEESAPSLVKGMQAYLKRERAAINREHEARVSTATKAIEERIEPLATAHSEAEVRDHFNTIEAAHPDFFEVVVSPELNAWVQKQPQYMQREFARIAQNGSAAEIVEVMDQFRAAHPRAAAPAAPAAPAVAPAVPAAPAPAADLNARREAQKRALGTTGSRPAPLNPAGAPNKDDFDAGFDLAASQT